jgi:hypothetical protein
VLVCLLLLAGALPALAQVSTGEIFGKATDGTGAVLPGVTVTLSGAALIQPQVAATTESGAYRFPRIVTASSSRRASTPRSTPRWTSPPSRKP